MYVRKDAHKYSKNGYFEMSVEPESTHRSHQHPHQHYYNNKLSNPSSTYYNPPGLIHVAKNIARFLLEIPARGYSTDMACFARKRQASV